MAVPGDIDLRPEANITSAFAMGNIKVIDYTENIGTLDFDTLLPDFIGCL